MLGIAITLAICFPLAALAAAALALWRKRLVVICVVAGLVAALGVILTDMWLFTLTDVTDYGVGWVAVQVIFLAVALGLLAVTWMNPDP